MKKYFVIMMALVMVSGLTAFGTPTLGYVETWGGGLGTDGNWQYQNVGDGASYVLQNVGNTLQVTLDNTTVPAARMFANVASSAGQFSGDFNSAVAGVPGATMFVRFNLASIDNNNVNPGSMSLYFIGNGNLYYLINDFTQPAPSASTLFGAAISSESLWNNVNLGTFASDFANVSEFGLQLTGSADLTIHRYQLDNFEVYATVPEPETIWMIVMVLVSLGITFRSRLYDLAGQVRARIST